MPQRIGGSRDELGSSEHAFGEGGIGAIDEEMVDQRPEGFRGCGQACFKAFGPRRNRIHLSAFGLSGDAQLSVIETDLR
jgi:hypothetical protein